MPAKPAGSCSRTAAETEREDRRRVEWSKHLFWTFREALSGWLIDNENGWIELRGGRNGSIDLRDSGVRLVVALTNAVGFLDDDDGIGRFAQVGSHFPKDIRTLIETLGGFDAKLVELVMLARAARDRLGSK